MCSAAVFPGGTITGCPKVRCMEIIAELEGAARGAYTGSLGYLNRDGSMDMNILIRSLEISGRELTLRAGAGIVADSIPERELEETRAKARGVLRARRCREHDALLCSSTASHPTIRCMRSPIEDRGFQYGDGVFETALLANGRVRFLDRHLRRLALGCERLGIAPPDAALLRSDVQRLSGSSTRGVLKIVVSRGIGPRGYRPSPRSQATRVVALYPAPAPPAIDGTGAALVRDPARTQCPPGGHQASQSPRTGARTGEWHDDAIVEGLMLDTEGELVSAHVGQRVPRP